MNEFKKNAIAKVTKSINKYLEEIKPNFSKKFNKVIWKKIYELLFGLIVGQSCFLNKIAENTPHYVKQSKKGKLLGKCAQVNKLSDYLLFPHFDLLISSFLKYLYKKYFSEDNLASPKLNSKYSFGQYSIENRVYNKKLALHDGSDIQKPHAKTMEMICHCRDGSQSSAKKTKTGKGYLMEGSIAFYRGRIFPLLISLYSYLEKNFKSEKEETKKNLLVLKAHKLSDCFLHVFDRGYDCAAFMCWCINESITFLIRATMSRHVILQDEFHDLIKEYKTQKDREGIFYSIQHLIKNKLSFKKHFDKKYSWFSIAFTKVFIKGDDYPRNMDNIIPTTFVSVRITNKKIKGIDEDLGFDNNATAGSKGEREIHFYTNASVNNIDDAIVIFLCYLKRWKIETFFRLLGQVFGLEEIRLQSFKKIKNICNLLPIATCYLYGYFRKFEKIEEKRQTQSLKSILNKEILITKRNDETILLEICYFCYQQFCRQKALTRNPDSFAKFIHDLMKNRVDYTNKTINYDFFDTG